MSKRNDEEDMHPLFRQPIREREAHPRGVPLLGFTRVGLQQQEEEEHERTGHNLQPIIVIRRNPTPPPNYPPNMHAVWFLE